MGHRLLQLKHKHQIRPFIVKLLLAWLSDSATAAFTGHVVSVLDSDTLEVLHYDPPRTYPLEWH
jgi:hypothetical protein